MRQMITIPKRRVYHSDTGISTDPNVPLDILIDSTYLIIDKRMGGIVLPHGNPLSFTEHFGTIG